MNGLLLGLAACAKIKDVEFRPNAIAGSGVVTFTSRKTGKAYVKFGKDAEHLDQRTPEVDASKGKVEVRGLANGSKYTFEVVIEDGGDSWTSRPSDEVTIGRTPDGVPGFVPSPDYPWDKDRSCLDGGYVLFGYIGDHKSGAAIVDREGQYVWAKAPESPDQISRVRPSRDGKSILYNTANEFKDSDTAAIVRQPFDGSKPKITRTVNGHHDFIELPDERTFVWPSYDIRRVDSLPGGNPDVVEGSSGCVAAEALLEGPEGMTEADTPTTIWDTWNDYSGGIYTVPPDGNTFFSKYKCSTAGIDGVDNPILLEFQHGNSLAYVDSQDAFYESWRWLDTIVKIDHSGELVWQWGGLAGAPPSDLVPANGTDPDIEHLHFSDVWSDGDTDRMLIYNNGHRESAVSGTTLREYSIEDGAGTFEMDWTHDPEEYDNVLGDVRRIPIEGCDNYLVSLSGQGVLQELTPEGDIVWELDPAGSGAIIGRVYFLPDLYDFSGLAYSE